MRFGVVEEVEFWILYYVNLLGSIKPTYDMSHIRFRDFEKQSVMDFQSVTVDQLTNWHMCIIDPRWRSIVLCFKSIWNRWCKHEMNHWKITPEFSKIYPRIISFVYSPVPVPIWFKLLTHKIAGQVIHSNESSKIFFCVQNNPQNGILLN